MRQRYPQAGLGALCGLFGKTRNAYYDHQRRATGQALLAGLVLELVADIRQELPRLGTRKLHFLLAERLGEHAGGVGRDYLFALSRPAWAYQGPSESGAPSGCEARNQAAPLSGAPAVRRP